MVLRIFEMIATSGFLTALERTKFAFGRGFAPDPAAEELTADPPPPYNWSLCQILHTAHVGQVLN